MDKVTWHTEKRRIKDLLPADNNPRKMSKEQAAQLKNSLGKFDYVELVAINTDNKIIAGHMRVKAMIQLGWGSKEVEVRVPSHTLSESECKEYLIRSNKNVGDWDQDELAQSWDANLLAEYGFTAAELTDILDIDDQLDDNKEEERPSCPECGQKIKDKKG